MAIPHPGWDPHESKEANVRLSAPVLTAMALVMLASGTEPARDSPPLPSIAL